MIVTWSNRTFLITSLALESSDVASRYNTSRDSLNALTILQKSRTSSKANTGMLQTLFL